VVGVVFEHYAAEEQGDDAGGGRAIGEEVVHVGRYGDEAGFDAGEEG
jgi:hypothetical protein